MAATESHVLGPVQADGARLLLRQAGGRGLLGFLSHAVQRARSGAVACRPQVHSKRLYSRGGEACQRRRLALPLRKKRQGLGPLLRGRREAGRSDQLASRTRNPK